MHTTEQTQQTVAVGERALIARINRKLAHDDQALRTTRGERAYLDLGSFYILNLRTNFIDAYRVSLEDLGREVGALKPYEYVVFTDGTTSR
jgi:hypothetical protein